MNVPSDRRNGILADVFDRLDYMEREGSGFKKIVGAYAPDVSRNPRGLSPKFYSAVGCFVVTLPNLNERKESGEVEDKPPIGSSKKSSEKSSKKSDERILDALRGDSALTLAGIAMATGLSVAGVRKVIDKLRVAGRIHRVGPDKGGHWEVV